MKGVRLIENLKFNEKGLIPAIAQDADTGAVLMLAYMNEEALRRTLSSGEAWFYSRSRQKLWHKGETSGNIIKVVSVWKDCDSDTILILGKPAGPACHTGNKTCFFQEITEL
jgi:phosphoribosyl-AMP cyclohydrolase